MTLYGLLRAIGAPLDHHESDLYVQATPRVRRVLRRYRRRCTRLGRPMPQGDGFVSQVDGHVWIDFPFAFLPFWTQKPR